MTVLALRAATATASAAEHRYSACVRLDGDTTFECLIVDRLGLWCWQEAELQDFGTALQVALRVTADSRHPAFRAPVLIELDE